MIQPKLSGRSDISPINMQSEEYKLEPGIIAIAGPKGAGKSTLAELICSDPTLSSKITVSVTTKVMANPKRKRPDDNRSKGQTIKKVNEPIFKQMQAKGQLDFHYTHYGVHYGVGGAFSESLTNLVPIQLNNDGVQALIEAHHNAPASMGKIRYVLLYLTSPFDLDDRLRAGGRDEGEIVKARRRYESEFQDYVRHLDRYGIIFATEQRPHIDQSDPIQEQISKRQEAVRVTYRRLLEALKHDISVHDEHPKYIDALVKRLFGVDAQEMMNEFNTGRRKWLSSRYSGLEIEFPRDTIESYAEEAHINSDEVRGVLPTHLVAYHDAYGILTLVFNQGRRYRAYPDAKQMVLSVLKNMLGVTQYEDTSNDYSSPIAQGLCKLPNHVLVTPVASWGLMDMPQFNRKPNHPRNRFLISMAGTTNTDKTPLLEIMTDAEVNYFYRRACFTRNPIY